MIAAELLSDPKTREIVHRRAALFARRYGMEREDWVQVAWIGAIRAARTFDPSLSSWATYCGSKCWRSMLDYAKQFQRLKRATLERQLPISEEGLEVDFADPNAAPPEAESDRERIESLLRRLGVGARARECYIGTKLEGRPASDLAKRFGLSESAIHFAIRSEFARAAEDPELRRAWLEGELV